VRVGDDLRGADGKAAAVADRRRLAPVLPDHYHPHHPARGGIDIAGIGGGGGCKGDQEQGEGAKKAGHARSYSHFFAPCDIERKGGGCAGGPGVANVSRETNKTFGR